MEMKLRNRQSKREAGTRTERETNARGGLRSQTRKAMTKVHNDGTDDTASAHPGTRTIPTSRVTVSDIEAAHRSESHHTAPREGDHELAHAHHAAMAATDLHHRQTLTQSKPSSDRFRNQKTPSGHAAAAFTRVHPLTSILTSRRHTTRAQTWEWTTTKPSRTIGTRLLRPCGIGRSGSRALVRG